MNLKQSYEFLRLIVEGEIETWEARDRATGKRVLVHLLLAGDAAANKRNVERISDLCKQNHELIGVGLDAEIPFVVTGTAFGSVGLREWSRIAESAAMPTQVWQRGPRANTGDAAPLPGPQRPRANPGVTNPASIPKAAAEGEFTRFFEPPPKPSAEQWVSRPDAPAYPPKSAGPGEFTRIFKEQQPARPADEGKRTPDRTSEQQQNGIVPPTQPGEFTRFFQSPFSSQPAGKTAPDQAGKPDEAENLFRPQSTPSPVPSSLAARPPASPAGSEFTQVFQRSSTALPTNPDLKSFTPMTEAAKEPLAPARAVEPEGKPNPPGAGDFTRIFNPGSRPAPDPAQRIEQKIEQATEPPRMSLPYAMPTAPAPPPPAQGAEAGEYTRVIGAAQAPKFQTPKAPAPVEALPKEVQAAKAASAKVKAKTPVKPFPLLAVLFGLLLLAVLIVVFFAIRR